MDRTAVVSPSRTRVLHVIARMNVGGTAAQVSLLAAKLDPLRFETMVVTGSLGAGEGSHEGLIEEYGLHGSRVRHLAPEIRPIADLRALGSLIRIMRRWRPDIVHTHTAKAGLLGRIAARVALGRRVVVVHTYHGHVLKGYFGTLKSRAFRAMEHGLAKASDLLIGVSKATVEELVDLGVGDPCRFAVVPIGLELGKFMDVGDPLPRARRMLGGAGDDIVVTFTGRLVPIKRVDMVIEAVRQARFRGVPIHLVIVGDGELRHSLEQLAESSGLAAHIAFLGFRDDLADIALGTDIAVLASDNEGTPVALIEAGASGRPSVATDVGGVSDILQPTTGLMVAPGDVPGFATALAELGADPHLRRRMGLAARNYVGESFSFVPMVREHERLYGELLESHGPAPHRRGWQEECAF